MATAEAPLPEMEPARIDVSLKLLQEYTGKLRSSTQSLSFELLSRQILTVVAIFGIVMLPNGYFLATGSTALVTFPTPLDPGNIAIQEAARRSSMLIGLGMSVFGGLMVMFPSIFLMMTRDDIRTRFHLTRTAADQVQRLIRAASQSADQIPQDYVHELQLDLRLAEAEGEIRLYEDAVLRRCQSWLSSNERIEHAMKRVLVPRQL